MRIAHVVNPVILEGSDLVVAQPITFESMRVAAEYVAPAIEVDLISAQYPEDRPIVPPFFDVTRDLDRSAIDIGSFQVPRKLPVLADLLQRMREASPDADYYVYTNVDIGLVPHFYASVAAPLEDHDALVINRRTIPAEPNRVDQLPLIYAWAGEIHAGFDCFVFKADLFDRLELGEIVIGAPWIGNAFLANLACHAERLNVMRVAHLTFHLGNDLVWRRPELNDYRVHNRHQFMKVINRWTAAGLIEGNEVIEPIVKRVNAEEAGLLPLGGAARRTSPKHRAARFLRRVAGRLER